MPRSPASAAPLARQPATPQAGEAVPQRLASPIDDSPRMLAQRRQIDALFGPRHGTGVVQGYFVINEQRTDDPDQFLDGASQPAKEAQVWETLKPALAAAWQVLPGRTDDPGLLEEFRTQMLAVAFSADKKTLAWAARTLDAIAAHRAAAKTELESRPSPAGVGGALTTSPTLADPDNFKHSAATYKRSTTAPDTGAVTVTEETFDPNSYTKTGEPTPKTGAQAWTKKQIKDSIRIWTGTVPLARHLAVTVWPLLANTDTGRLWEVKFREMDRLITYRDNEAQNLNIEVRQDSTNTAVRTFARKAYNTRARLALKKAILDGTPPPDKQQGVLFYDALLKADADPAWRVADSETFAVGPGYSTIGSLSMILTHWRPILLFDWILAQDVLDNAADA